MSTPRTSEVLNQLMDDKGEIYEGNCPEKLVKLARTLESELAAVTKKLELCMAANSDVRRIALERDSFEMQLAAVKKERDEWMELSVKSSQEREHNAMMALAYKAELAAEREKVAKLRDALRDTMGHIYGEHPHWISASKSLAETAPKEGAK